MAKDTNATAEHYEQAYHDLRDWLMHLVGSASTTNSAKRTIERCVEASLKENRLRRQVAEIADWIERDRREPDKILTEVASLRRALLDAEI